MKRIFALVVAVMASSANAADLNEQSWTGSLFLSPGNDGVFDKSQPPVDRDYASEFDGRLVRYAFPLVVPEKVGSVIAEAVLNDDRTIDVTLKQYEPHTLIVEGPAHERRFTRRLSGSVYTTLYRKVKVLADAELSEEFRRFVCATIRSRDGQVERDLYIARYFDADSDTFAQGLTLVQTQPGCWRPYLVDFVDDWAYDTAVALRAQLEIVVTDHSHRYVRALAARADKR